MLRSRFICIVLIALVIVFFLWAVYNEIYEIDIDYELKALDNNCRYMSYSLNKLLEDSRNFLELTAKYPIIMDLSLTHLETFIKSLVQKFDIFNTVYVIDSHGKTLIDATQVPELFDGVPSQQWFANVIKGQYSDYTTGVYKSGITGRYALTQAVLVRGPMFDLRAVLAAEIDMSYLWDHFTKLLPKEKEINVYLVDDRNSVIYSDDASFSNSESKAFSGLTGIDQSHFNKRNGNFILNSKGILTLGSYYSLRSVDEIRGMNWKIIVLKKKSGLRHTENISLSGFLNILVYMMLFAIILVVLNYIFLYFGVDQNENI